MTIDGPNLWNSYFNEWERIEKEILLLLRDESDNEKGNLSVFPNSECQEGGCPVGLTQADEKFDRRQADQNLAHFASRLEVENKALMRKTKSSFSIPIATDSRLYPIFCYQLDLSRLSASESSSPISQTSTAFFNSPSEQKGEKDNHDSYFSRNLFH